MKTDKEIKKEFKAKASANPDDYYATSVLKKEGFERKQCDCGTFFWTTHKDRKVCGDPSCAGGFDVVSDNPAKNKLSYVDTWKKIVETLEPRGYKPIKRYPVVARWNPTAEFTMASIAAFQPYVISGEVEPPARKLLIPQFSLRFGDIDNVGITGSHMTGFVMIGQHMFVDEKEWSQAQAFQDIYDFITIGVGLSKDEITLHEDAWAGGGNFGPCMEFFSRGVELMNQVYMMFEQTEEGSIPLKIKVLDMGLGMERVTWFSQGLPNIYEATFPYVLEKLREIAHVEMDHELYNRFSAYSAYLNIDEVEDINAAWNDVANKLGIDDPEELKDKILPMTGLYSIAEHVRALLFAISDGGLPSNVGGGYNLRTILRRALGFIDRFNWDIDLGKVAEWHAYELKEIFPELSEHLDDVKAVLANEKKKYEATKEKARNIVQRIIKSDITEKVLLELYDSNGINPDIIKEEAKKLGKDVIVPDDFFSKVSELHEKKQTTYATKKDAGLDLEGIDATEILYFEDHKTDKFEAKVLKIIDDNIILDRTYFYPTSGGQFHDDGSISGKKIVDIFKQGQIVVHKVEKDHNITEGETVSCVIDLDTRMQLTQHHTATHIVNAAAKRILGNHIFQAGARKTIEKSTLDITHFDSLSDEELKLIEVEANKIVQESHDITKVFMSRTDAEQTYGMEIYQGGAVPGKNIRIVNVEGVDVEACGGTHLDNTKEIGEIKILKSSKIQDGIVRLEFTAGAKAKESGAAEDDILDEACKVLDVSKDHLISAAENLFTAWKKSVKAAKKKKAVEDMSMFEVSSVSKSDSDVLVRLTQILRTQPEHIVRTLSRFKKELEENISKIKNF
ncbi:alanine--tRNA ligase [Candidatus Woesearchaeota archaeon]|nr:MAG: alanine--tRNA ligase [Candidatus Woesearchaeota archaeon]